MAYKFLQNQVSNVHTTVKDYLPEPLSRPTPLILTATAGTLGSWLLWRAWRNRNKKPPPSAPGWPILGNLLELSEKFHEDAIRIQKKYNLPDVYTLKCGPWKEFIMLNSYEVIKDAFVTQGDLFAERPFSASFDMMNFRDEIFNKPYSDPTWNEGKAFIMANMKSVGLGTSKASEDLILEHVERLMTVLDRKSLEGKPTGMDHLLYQLAGGVIFQILFGKVYDLDDAELMKRNGIVRDWYTVLGSVACFELLPYWMGKMLGGKKMLRATDNVRAFIKEEIEEHLSTIDYSEPRDFLDAYLTKKKGAVDEQLLTDTVIDFLPDAIDSLGCLINWIILYCTHHNDVTTRMQQDVDKVTGGNRLVKWSDKPDLPYVEAVILEVIRVTCPIYATAEHTPIRDCYFRGFFIPKGASVIGNLYAAMMDPQNFENPVEFNPDRWINDGKLGRTDIWIPFSMGRRKCVGEQITRIEVFLCVANLLQRYNFRFPEGEPAPTLESRIENVALVPHPYKVLLEIRN